MIPKECKRLIEVDFPIAEVSRHSAREKSIGHGHPCTLHLWWARRPLAACRAVLMGLLMPDPCDEHCPPDFKPAARAALKPLQGTAKDDMGLRKALLKFIADFANWDNSSVPAYLEAARALVKAAHPEETPLVVDPFAGGGSIPLEALRVGCDAFASDLNPVACLILKVMLEDIPRHGPKLAEELRRVGRQIKEQAEKELAEFYPPDPDGAKPIAYLWARTVRCESPDCGAEIPLVHSFWLSRNAKGKRALCYRVERPKGKPPHVEFEVFEPKGDKDVPPGTVRRALVTCVCCGATLPPPRVRSQLAAQRGGADTIFDARGHRSGGARLLAVVTLRPGERGHHYRIPADGDYHAVCRAQQAVDKLPNGVIPDEPLPPVGTLGFRVQRYGMLQWRDLFTSRQKAALAKFIAILRGQPEGEAAVKPFLACALSRVAMSGMSCTWWNAAAEKMQHTFGRQALPIVWDFAEVVPTADAPGSWDSGYELVAKVVSAWPTGSPVGQAQLADARCSPAVTESGAVWFTDPPYYDAVPYADLSDFFFVWLKRTLPGHPILRDPFDPHNVLTPKAAEIVQHEQREFAEQDEEGHVVTRLKDKAFFEEMMGRAFAEGRRVLSNDGVGCVVFAHKTTEGWEALLSGMLSGGWTITASWPITTEMRTRLRARESAALAASIHLVGRPRHVDAGIGDWGEIIRALPRRINEWIDRLSSEGIRGADLVFACIGPALELFSKYERVETPDGEEVGLGPNPKAKGEPARRGFLSYIWEVVGRTALNQILGTAEATACNSAVGALEEDARLTALFLWTLQATSPLPDGRGSDKENDDSHPSRDGDGASSDDEDDDSDESPSRDRQGAVKRGGFSLIYDVARRFAQPLGIHLEDWEGRIIQTEKGVVRLLPVVERAKQLFGEEGASAVARRYEEAAQRDPQAKFAFMAEVERGAVPEIRGRGRRRGGERSRDREGADVHAPATTRDGAAMRPLPDGRGSERQREATTLDRVHAAMLLQSGGQTNALRALLESEVSRGPEFLRLANALSALYPKTSEEKRLLDAMLLAVPRR